MYFFQSHHDHGDEQARELRPIPKTEPPADTGAVHDRSTVSPEVPVACGLPGGDGPSWPHRPVMEAMSLRTRRAAVGPPLTRRHGGRRLPLVHGR